jgi:RNA polymerase sigma factor (TIGR02999 family)
MSKDITGLLQDPAARDELYGAVYGELMRLARGTLAKSATISLDAPALLHEAYLRLSAKDRGHFPNRKAFFGYAAAAMRSVLADFARERRALRRGGGERPVTLSTGALEGEFREEQLPDLDDAIAQLAKVDPRCKQVVEMRYFGGMTEPEIAELLEVSVPTVKRDWRKARAFLYDCLK